MHSTLVAAERPDQHLADVLLSHGVPLWQRDRKQGAMHVAQLLNDLPVRAPAPLDRVPCRRHPRTLRDPVRPHHPHAQPHQVPSACSRRLLLGHQRRRHRRCTPPGQG